MTTQTSEFQCHVSSAAVGRVVTVVIACLFVIIDLPTSCGGELRVGWAAVSITPPPTGMPFQAPQRPPYRAVLSEGVHDPLHARALLFEHDGQKAAVVVCDLTSTPVGIINDARKLISERTGLAAERVMILSTHTHTGPQVRPRFLRGADPPAREMAENYIAELPLLIADSVVAAERTLAPARVRAGVATAEGLCFNRRFIMQDGTVLANPGKDDPQLLHDIVRPAGPVDPAVPIVAFESADSERAAVLVNYAMHLDTTGGKAFSADYPYALGQVLKDAIKPDLFTVFTIGAAGNINHYDLLDPVRYHRTKSYAESARIGSVLAAKVLEAWPQLEPQTIESLQIGSTTVRLRMPREKGADIAKRFGNRPSFFDGEVTVTRVGDDWTFEAEVQVITLGNELALVGLPGEPFVELGLAIKLASPYRITIIQGLANGPIGYVPDRKAHSQGAYGASFRTTRCAPGSGEALVEAATKLLVEMRGFEPTP